MGGGNTLIIAIEKTSSGENFFRTPNYGTRQDDGSYYAYVEAHTIRRPVIFRVASPVQE